MEKFLRNALLFFVLILIWIFRVAVGGLISVMYGIVFYPLTFIFIAFNKVIMTSTITYSKGENNRISLLSLLAFNRWLEKRNPDDNSCIFFNEIENIIFNDEEEAEYFSQRYDLQITPKGNLLYQTISHISEINLYTVEIPFWKKDLLHLFQEYNFPILLEENIIIFSGGSKVRVIYRVLWEPPEPPDEDEDNE